MLTILLNVVVAKTIQTPFESIKNLEFFGKVVYINYDDKNKWLKNSKINITKYLQTQNFKKSIGNLYKKTSQIYLQDIHNKDYWVDKYI